MAAQDWLRAEQFGFKPEDEEASSHVRMEARDPDASSQTRTLSVRPGRFRATQSHIDPERVNRYSQGWSEAKGDPIHVARYNDEEYLLNGHHRVASVKASKRVKVSYTNLDTA